MVSRKRRQLLAEMMGFVRQLPIIMRQPLPEAMRSVTDGKHSRVAFSQESVRELADLASVLERRSVPGICLKRSLTRYRYLHDVLTLEVVFGAQLKKGDEKRDVAGHAWLELDGKAWQESAENYENFIPIYRWPVQNHD